MKKKVLTAVLCLALIGCLFGCKSAGEGTTGSTDGTSGSAAEGTAAPVEQTNIVEENLLDVTVTIPASMFGQSAPATAELTQEQKDQGFKSAVVNADGSVTYTISKKAFNEFKTEMKKSTMETLNTLSTQYTSIKSVEFSDNFSTVTLKVDKAAYESGMDSMCVFLVGIQANMYQAYAGETVKSDITVSDASTGEVISTAVYPLA